jgi:hypothetical protein
MHRVGRKDDAECETGINSVSLSFRFHAVLQKRQRYVFVSHDGAQVVIDTIELDAKKIVVANISVSSTLTSTS